MGMFDEVPGLSGYQKQTALNQQQESGQLNKLAQILGIQNESMKMQVQQDQLSRQNKIRDALMNMNGASQPAGNDGATQATGSSAGQPALSSGGAGRALAEKLNRTADIYEQHGEFDAAMKIREHAQKLMPELKDEQVRMGPQGTPIVVRNYKDGTTEVSPFAPAEKLHFADNGQQTGIGINPYTGKVMAPGMQKMATPGEMMTDQRTRSEGALNRAQSERHFQTPSLQHVETDQGIFAFNPRTAATAPVMGPDGKPLESAKGLTEVQAKGVGFATRAKQASDQINTVGKGGEVQPGAIKRVLESTPLIGEGLGTMANVTQSPAQQQVEQAQRNFVNAILRQESGAAISESEFINAKKQYFPQPGDTPEVIKQKAQNRETAIRALEIQAGPGMKKVGIGNKKPEPNKNITVDW